MHPLQIGLLVLECVSLYVLATFAGDVVHLALHHATRSSSPLARRLGAMHQVHHRFFGADLRIHREHALGNLLLHRLPELGTRLGATAAGLLVFPLPVVLVVLAGETLMFAVGTLEGGADSNHRDDGPRRCMTGWVVGPTYHAYHHAFPDSYMASATTAFDFIFAKGCQIRGRCFAVTGAGGAFGGPLCAMLEAEGARVVRLKYGRDFAYGDYARLDAALAAADVLVLCHGSKVLSAMEANCDSFVALIQRFRALGEARPLPVEVWAVGSEIEAHPDWGNPELAIYKRSKVAFARHARRYFHDPSLVYRHIVPSAFTSPMGPGLMSGRAAARVALFFIRRGFRYVPVTYTGIAFVNWLKFAWAGLRRPWGAPIRKRSAAPSN